MMKILEKEYLKLLDYQKFDSDRWKGRSELYRQLQIFGRTYQTLLFKQQQKERVIINNIILIKFIVDYISHRITSALVTQLHLAKGHHRNHH